MSFHAYLLRCSDGRYYVGHTDDLDRRIGEHVSGVFRGYTSSRLPVELVWSETFQSRVEAIEAELRIKRWSRAKKEALIVGNWAAPRAAAIPPRERGERSEGVSTSLDMNGSGMTEPEAKPEQHAGCEVG